MKKVEDYEVLESIAVAMDPVLDGFAGVLVELVFDGERYAFSEMALGSGNRLLRFRSEDRRLAYAFFEAELPDDGAGRPKSSAGFAGNA